MKAKVYSDDRNIEHVLANILAKFGFEDIGYHSCSHLERLMPKDFDDIMLIVDIDQNDFLSQLWQLSSRVGILFLGVEKPADLDRHYKPPHGELQYVRKPFSEAKVLESIQHIINNDAQFEVGALDSKTSSIDPKRKKKFDHLISQYITEVEKYSRLLHADSDELKILMKNGEAHPQDFPLKRVLVIDQDESHSKKLCDILKTMSVFEVHQSSHGLDGWGKILDSDYDLIVLDWGVQDITGLGLYNRIRFRQTLLDQAMVALIPKDDSSDLRLLQDDPFLHALERSSPKRELISGIREVVLASIINNLLFEKTYLFMKDAPTDRSFYAEIPPKVGHLFRLALRQVGERFVRENKLIQAENAFKLCWSLGDNSPSTLASLAKVYHCQNRHHKAARVLSKADVMAPGDLKRICLKGEVQLWTHNFDDALNSFQKALRMDPKCKKARAGQTMVTKLMENREDEMAESKGHLGSPLNMTAIYMARQRKFKAALRYYLAAYSFVHTDIDRGKILFNIGLCYRRAGKEDQATIAFQRSYSESNGAFEKGIQSIATPEQDDSDLEEFSDESLFD